MSNNNTTATEHSNESVAQDSNADYRVGYGHPPKRSQFQRGHSGNPKGRPKQKQNLWGELKDVYMGQVVLREGDKRTRMKRVVALARKMMELGLKGDYRATQAAIKIAKDLGVLDEIELDKASRPSFITREIAAEMSDGTLAELIALEKKMGERRAAEKASLVRRP